MLAEVAALCRGNWLWLRLPGWHLALHPPFAVKHRTVTSVSALDHARPRGLMLLASRQYLAHAGLSVDNVVKRFCLDKAVGNAGQWERQG
ncbi:unnamed protein product [Rangifer tarandus platyrhynchus]|uniref:Uncharacterized protein n=1 Tax=Rangifer tarandus platyrhynchus TaxID=3082113 RepID=A0AC59YAJ4_RANTA